MYFIYRVYLHHRLTIPYSEYRRLRLAILFLSFTEVEWGIVNSSGFSRSHLSSIRRTELFLKFSEKSSFCYRGWTFSYKCVVSGAARHSLHVGPIDFVLSRMYMCPPSRHMTSDRRQCDVMTSHRWRRIDVDMMSFWRHVPAGRRTLKTLPDCRPNTMCFSYFQRIWIYIHQGWLFTNTSLHTCFQCRYVQYFI